MAHNILAQGKQRADPGKKIKINQPQMGRHIPKDALINSKKSRSLNGS